MITESDRESARFLFKRFVVAVNSSPGAALAAEVAAALAAR